MTEVCPVASLAQEVIVEVGPATIRGPSNARPEWVCAALDCIDDEIALIDDCPVSVPEVWRDVMSTVTGVDVDAVVLVCPGWWPATRVDKVRRAAYTVASTVVVLERTSMLRQGISPRTTIVEIASELVVVSALGMLAAVIPRHDESVDDAEAVVATVGMPTAVLVDAPTGVPGAELLGALVGDRLRAKKIPVTYPDDDWVQRAAVARRTSDLVADVTVARSGVFRDRKRLAVLSGTVSAALLCGGFAVVHDTGSDPSADDMPMTLLVEGRVGVSVPAAWAAQRIISGPGSARVQVVSPSDRDVALHITQAGNPMQSSLADSLRTALGAEPDGIFVEFNPSDRRADRDAVTYREIRADHHVAWTVLLDGTIRIAVGCQSPPGSQHLVREACDRAIRSAHAVF
jgi:type VII secretion-associated protein (TIGR03931 family)